MAELFEPIGEEEYEALKANIAVNGMLRPVVKDENGDVVSGECRMRAAKALGIRPKVQRIDFKGDKIKRALFAVQDNFVHSTGSERMTQKRDTALKLHKLCGKKGSAERIAMALRVHPETVRGWTKEAREAEEQERNAEIKRLAGDGLKQREIARKVGTGLATVSRVLSVPKSARAGNGTAPPTKAAPARAQSAPALSSKSNGKGNGKTPKPGIVEASEEEAEKAELRKQWLDHIWGSLFIMCENQPPISVEEVAEYRQSGELSICHTDPDQLLEGIKYLKKLHRLLTSKTKKQPKALVTL